MLKCKLFDQTKLLWFLRFEKVVSDHDDDQSSMSARLKDVELKMDQLLNNVNLLVSKLDKKETIYPSCHTNSGFVAYEP